MQRNHPPSMEPHNLQRTIQRASLLMVVSIILSRVIGFFREWIIAHTVGATPMTDVYYASFTLPDFLNYLMAAGALSITFIPVLSEVMARSTTQQAERLYRSLLTLMGFIILCLIGLAEVFTPQLARWIAPGFTPEQTHVLVGLLRVILPAQFFFYCGSLAMAVQQAQGVFRYAALAPIVYNTAIIVCGLLLHSSLGVAGFSVGVLVGAFFSHGLLQWWGALRVGFRSMPLWDFSPEIRQAMRRYVYLSLPLVLGFSLVATDEWISKYFASHLEPRALSWMSYARTQMRIPIAVIGQAAGVASFPFLARLWAGDQTLQYGQTVLRELMKLVAAAPVAAWVLWRFSESATHALFGSGRFSSHDIVQTAAAVRMFSVGVFFWTAQVVLARAFYAAQMTWLPSILGGVCSLVAIGLYRWLGALWGFEGLALGSSLAIALYATLLWGLLQWHLRSRCRELKFTSFYAFVFSWLGVCVGLAMLAEGIAMMGIYQNTRGSAFAEIIAVCVVLGGMAVALLRTVFRKLTGGPLF